jgi:hypothetical protein
MFPISANKRFTTLRSLKNRHGKTGETTSHSCIKKVAKRVKTIMDKGQSKVQGHFRGINQK